MLHGLPKELRKHQPHDQQREQRGEQAPRHSQHRSFIFLFEIPLYQFLKQELVSLHFLNHGIPLCFLPGELIFGPREKVFYDVLEADFAISIQFQCQIFHICFILYKRISSVLRLILPPN